MDWLIDITVADPDENGFAILPSPFLTDDEGLGGTIAIGMTVVDGQGANAVVYTFVDDEAAIAALEQRWTSSTLQADDGPITDRYTLRSIEQRGPGVDATRGVRGHLRPGRERRGGPR